MKAYRGYIYRIYPTKAQKQMITKTVGAVRFVYNSILKAHSAGGSNKSAYNSSAMLQQLILNNRWLTEIEFPVLDASRRNLEKALQRCYMGTSEYPRPRLKRYRQTFYLPGKSVWLENDKYLHLGSLGLVRIHLSRELCGKIINTTVIKTSTEKYYVAICQVSHDNECCESANEGGKIGLDMGLRKLYTDNTNNKIDYPIKLKAVQKRCRRMQHRLARMQKGSNKYRNQCSRITRLRERIANIRNNFLQEKTTELVRNNNFIAIENIDLQEMMGINQTMHATVITKAWRKFTTMLTYKAPKYNAHVVKIAKYYPSSQLCSECGFLNRLIKKTRIQEWVCPRCGCRHQRDVNAAKNILAEAERIVATTTERIP